MEVQRAAHGRWHGDPEGLADAVLAHDRRALARAITLVENGAPDGSAVARLVYATTGHARLVGLTGPPGVGKSSLVAALIRHVRRQTPEAGIGVLGVDPSSPFTHGALLGDRIRLADHFLDPKVFIRSMGTRGHLGGISETTLQAVLLLDAFGVDEIFVETVGVGQSEVQVASLADTVVLVLMPGSGDAVQALKAGIMEIPDIIVVNKADHPQARALRQHVRSILMLDTQRAWMPPIISTEAIDDTGIDELWSEIGRHRAFLAENGRMDRRRRASMQGEILALASARASRMLSARIAADPHLQEMVEAVHARELDPLSCVERLFGEVFDTSERATAGTLRPAASTGDHEEAR